MLPPFNERGDLPPGIYRAAWAEIDARFGTGSAARRRLAGTLRHVHALAMRTGHLERFLIFGSFVTDKELPGDVDVVLVMAEAFKLEEAASRITDTVLARRGGCALRRECVLGTSRNPA
jgi:hypothetical protein